MPPEVWPKRKPAAIVWDLDGTLVDSAGDLRTALNSVLSARGLEPCSLAAVRGMIGHGVARLIQRGFAASGQDLEAERVRQIIPEFMRVYAERATAHTRPYPGIADLLERIAEAGIPQAVCTNKPEAVSRTILRALDLDRFFDNVIGGDSTDRPKPDPLPLLTCLQSLGVDPRQSLMIGDSATDLETARAAGVPVALVAWGYSRIAPAELGADFLLEALPGSLPGWLV